MTDKNQQQKIELVREAFGCAREFDHFIANKAERAFESLLPNLLPERPVIHEELLSRFTEMCDTMETIRAKQATSDRIVWEADKIIDALSDFRFHAGNNKIAKINNAKVIKLPKCEGGENAVYAMCFEKLAEAMYEYQKAREHLEGKEDDNR